MEPLLVGAPSPQRAELTDLALELASASAALRSALPEGIVSAPAPHVRAMNCYYSNLIEGHDAHPIDIERALKDDFSREPQKRDLQIEARAHIAVRAWIDEGGLSSSPTSPASLVVIHRRFCAALPPEFPEADDPGTDERVPVTPGEFRKRDVRVGRFMFRNRPLRLDLLTPPDGKRTDPIHIPALGAPAQVQAGPAGPGSPG